ncbi:hypothetical protein LOTGIDRAFT_165450 [Lottia gigantea]|uniref:Uncharacterized protein n=1 Tax=Lottia gigantea TaxID=225164 RepID=V4A150_LOTGI|nr:hypothetical protein LOTGIDRAFT_165450 [Lottia gigantea]ESO88665.1 hypothetical protein LOTGIDRAFT_165450 [Lottia gigantea]
MAQSMLIDVFIDRLKEDTIVKGLLKDSPATFDQAVNKAATMQHNTRAIQMRRGPNIEEPMDTTSSLLGLTFIRTLFGQNYTYRSAGVEYSILGSDTRSFFKNVWKRKSCRIELGERSRKGCNKNLKELTLLQDYKRIG